MLLALSIVGLFVLPDPWRLILFAIAALAEVGEIFLWIRFLERYRIRSGVEALIGLEAEALEAIDPEGRVRLRGHEIWNARTGDPIEAGDRVEVMGVEGLRLDVRPLAEPARRAEEV